MVRNAALATMVIATLIGVGVASAEEHSYRAEPEARTCIDKRISELLEAGTRNVTGDAGLQACSKELQTELKGAGKTDCEVSDYTRWLVANVNSKRYGLEGQPYKPDKDFIARCKKGDGAGPPPPAGEHPKPAAGKPPTPRPPQ